MRFCLTFILALLFESIFAQDSCFQQPLFVIDNYLQDTSYPISNRLDDYINSFTGCNAPQFTATTLSGKKIYSKELEGKVTILNFWFTHCKPCIDDFPSLNKLADEYSTKGVAFLSFALDDKDLLDSFLLQHPLKYNVVPASKDLAELFKIAAYPTTMILDKNFKVVKILHGGNTNPGENFKNYELLKPYIEEQLKKKH